MSNAVNNLRATAMRISIRRASQVLIVAACGAFFIYAFASSPARAFDREALPEKIANEPVSNMAADFSRFTHSNQFHSRLPCLLCHRRDTNSPRVGFPGKIDHLPCAGCHTAQFNDQSSPICTICHTNPQTGAMKRFPGLRSFGARFNHAKHLRTGCATCHAPQRNGVAKSIPSGASAHITCFRCHTAGSAFTMSSCNVCHQPGRLVRTPEWTRAFRYRFSHAKHSTNCSSCHTVRAGSARGNQVTAPLASMHFAPANSVSCGGCHNGKRAFGPDDFSNCKRCHVGNTFKF